MKFSLIFLIIFFFTTSAYPQSNVIYDLEPGIKELEELYIAAWAKVKKIQGYRIQIVALSGSNSRIAIEKIETDFKQLFSNIPTYITYFEPNFRFRIGDFRTKLEAYKTLKRVRNQYTGAFIVRDQINYME